MGKTIKHKTSKNVIAPIPETAKTVAFSFKYLTADKRYNFEKLDKGGKREWCAALFERAVEISSESWLVWLNKRKEVGIETIPAESLNFASKDRRFSPDEKVAIFRFNKGCGRIIGIKESKSAVFYVIGLDTDYSAYNHGA